ncbi:MAG: S24/S26 family peptidase [Candidatus Pacebacteria bacterium]|nr:S24/S26 family peptidase [Candidatus Paceibacterota bacterium]
MFPSITPQEELWLQTLAVPKIGDVIVFENRLGMKIAHRLVHRVGNYYFTRGDTCKIINFPCRKEKILGVVEGKNRNIRVSLFLKLGLDIFLLNYLIYETLRDVRRKNHFLLLTLVSRYLAPPPLPFIGAPK